MNLSHFSVSSNLCYFPAGSSFVSSAVGAGRALTLASPLCPVCSSQHTWVLLSSGSIPPTFQKSALVLSAMKKGKLA